MLVLMVAAFATGCQGPASDGAGPDPAEHEGATARRGLTVLTGLPSGFADLGGNLGSQPVVVMNAANHLQVFARGAAGDVVTITQDPRGGPSGWTGWSSLGGAVQGEISVASNQDLRLEVFARGTDNLIYHIYQLSPGGPWSSWSAISTLPMAGGPVAARDADGRLQVVATTSPGDYVLYARQQAPNSTMWSLWSPVGNANMRELRVVSRSDGQLVAFGKDSTNAIYWTEWTGAAWAAWSGLSGSVGVGRLAPVLNTDGRIGLLTKGADGAIYLVSELLAGDLNRLDTQNLGGSSQAEPDAVLGACGTVLLFTQGADGHLYRATQGNGWSDWISMGGSIASGPIVARNADGRVEVFVKGSNGALGHSWEGFPCHWQSPIGSFDQVNNTATASGNLQQMALSSDGQQIFIREYANGAWGGWATSSTRQMIALDRIRSISQSALNGVKVQQVLSWDGTMLYTNELGSGWVTAQVQRVSALNIPGVTRLLDFEQNEGDVTTSGKPQQTALSADGATLYVRSANNGIWDPTWTPMRVEQLGISNVGAVRSFSRGINPQNLPKQDVLSNDLETLYYRFFDPVTGWGPWSSMPANQLHL